MRSLRNRTTRASIIFHIFSIFFEKRNNKWIRAGDTIFTCEADGITWIISLFISWNSEEKRRWTLFYYRTTGRDVFEGRVNCCKYFLLEIHEKGAGRERRAKVSSLMETRSFSRMTWLGLENDLPLFFFWTVCNPPAYPQCEIRLFRFSTAIEKIIIKKSVERFISSFILYLH